jgi:hypothetical protein
MQDDVTGDELAQSIAAFVIPSVYCLIHIIHSSVFGKRGSLLRPQPDWEILVLSWFLFGVAGSSLAVLTARTRDVRFHLGLEGVGLLSMDVLLVRWFSLRLDSMYSLVFR